MTNQYYDRTVNTDVRNETYPYESATEVLKLREIQAMETVAESLRSIAISFSTIVTMIENDLKEEQAFRLVNERRNSNLF